MTAIASVENLLYGGRALVGFTDEGERIAGWPEVAYESIRAINHLTGQGPIPAPTAYRILGELKGVGHLLPQALEQLCRGLQTSVAAFDVYDHRRDPDESVLDAVALLAQASRKAADLGQLLEDAQARAFLDGRRVAAPRDRPRVTGPHAWVAWFAIACHQQPPKEMDSR